jgi:ABC-type transporter Mla subunit MlaD
MANDGTIQSKLQLDGEKQYKQALNDAYRSLRVLRSELKAETAELGRNASEQDKARAKMKSLQQQIQQQEKIVKTLEKALADSKKEYADNQEVQDKWAEKLNKARAALADMQNQLGACDDSLSKFSSEMKDVADSSGQAMQTVVSFNDCIKSIGSVVSGIGSDVAGIFTAAVDTMKEMIDQMFQLMGMAWSAAADWKDIQAMWGGDLKGIEKVFTAMELRGIDGGEINSAIQKLVSNTHSGNKDTMEALKELHIEESQFNNHWDYFIAVMDALSRKKDEKLAYKIFGDKKATGALQLLDNWREGLAEYEKDFENTGVEIGTEEIEALDAVEKKIKEVQRLWNGIKRNIGAKLSEILNMDQLSEDALNILRTIGAILNSEGETRAELVLKLSDDITKIITDIETAMDNLSGFLKELGGDLKKSDNPLVRFIGQVIEGLGGILDWLATHGDEITGFLETVIPWVLKNKIVEATTGKGIGDWVTDIFQTGLEIVAISRLGKSFGAAAGAEIGKTATTFGTGIGTALLAKIPGLASFLGQATVSGLANGLPIFDWFFNNTNLGRSLSGKQSWEETGKEYSDYFTHTFSEENWNDFLDNWNPNSENANPIARLFRGTGALYTPSTPEEADWRPSYMKGWDNKSPEAEEIVEDVELDWVYDLADKTQAIQDWWDARRNAEAGIDTWEEESSAFDWMQEVLGDQFGAFWDRFLQESEDKDLSNMEDIPANWYADISGALKNLSQDNYRGAMDEDMPGKISSAVASAVKGIPITVNVYVDGEEVGATTNRYLGGQLSNLFG